VTLESLQEDDTLLATIKDVAKLAGVSIATVSRVFNNRGYLSHDVKQKVALAMEKLDYHPNDLARSLHNQKSFILGLIVPSVGHPFFGELASYVECFAYRYGYKVLIGNSLQEAEKEREYIAMLRRSQVDGIIMGSHNLDTGTYLGVNLRVISLDRELDPAIPYVCCDNYQGGELAAKYLIGKGCKNLILFSGNLSIPMLSNLRTEAFINTCEKAGVDFLGFELPDTSIIQFNEDGYIKEILKKNPRCDGVFCTNDMTAASVLNSASSLGRKIPGELKIIGFDGTLLSAFTNPRLTTIRQPVETICRYAVEYLIRMADGEKVPTKTVLPVRLIEGGTT
jgi:LacI family sucrose operon transcriptional repressor